MAPLTFENVVFFYDAASEAVFDGLSVQFERGWTGIVGPNGCGKSTLLRLAAGELDPTRGQIRRPGAVTYCAQRTDEPPPGWAAFLGSAEARACRLRGRLGVRPAWFDRWETLSHGERKRAQLGTALWNTPAVLALDEPTNHIDAATRDLLVQVLRRFDGLGLLVSHDRELLDALCGQCLLMGPGYARLRPGGYTQASAQQRADEAYVQAQRDAARAELKRLQREAQQRRQAADQADQARSKRHIDRHDHSAKAAIDAARVTGKDAVAGRRLRQLQGRIVQAAARVDEHSMRNPGKMGIQFQGTQARRPVLLRLGAGELTLGDGRRLTWPALTIPRAARIALTGANGTGKSTLVRHLLAQLDLTEEAVVYLAQELDSVQATAAVDELRHLPPARRGEVLSHISRLGSDPLAVLATELPSPGEARKILLALGMTRQPCLIVMDEPTNHLDLPSIECLEAALADCPIALLLVSHDMSFLSRCVGSRWIFEDEDDGSISVRTGDVRGPV